jgi:hypothetical protein
VIRNPVLMEDGAKCELLLDRAAVDTDEVVLQARVEHGTLRFAWGTAPGELREFGPVLDATFMSDEATANSPERWSDSPASTPTARTCSPTSTGSTCGTDTPPPRRRRPAPSPPPPPAARPAPTAHRKSPSTYGHRRVIMRESSAARNSAAAATFRSVTSRGIA